MEERLFAHRRDLFTRLDLNAFSRGRAKKVVLTINRNSGERYYCRVMWRTECKLGVLFMNNFR